MSGTFCPRCGGVHGPESSPCDQAHEGRTLPDGLRVLQALGPVSLGALYRAETPTHVEVDILFLDPGVTARMRPQLSRAAIVNHPNVAAVRGVGQTPEGLCYVAFELLQGELLSQVLKVRQILPLTEAADLILQAAAGLHAVHVAGLLHGSLSPETILVTRTADHPPLVKLIRFGLMECGPEADAGIRYAAPERLAGDPIDERSDVFSLGAVLFHLLAGAPPNTGLARPERVSDAAWSVISKALDPVPERRFPTVAAFAEALAQVTTRPRTWAWSRAAAWRGRAAGALAASLIVAVAGFWVMWHAQRARHDTAPVEAASARETDATPEVQESARSPSPPIGAAPVPSPRESGKPPAMMEPRRPSPTKPRSATRESTVSKPVTPPLPEPEPPASLELDARLQQPLRLPPIAAAPSLDTAGVALAPAARKHSEAEARAAVSRAVATYARALESNDLRAVEWAYPELSEREREAWKKFFNVARDLVVTLNIERYAIAESEANIDVRGTYQYWNRSLHRSERAPVRFLATLKQSADGWRLVAIH
jgi:serine/threonine protein kinase